MNNDNRDIIDKDFAGCHILEKVGQGGMGSVYKAKHLTLNKTVCVKLLSKELSYDQRNIEFFMREARSAAKLDHPNIVHVYNFGEENGQYFIVMSYVEGKTLQDVLNEKKVLSIPEASNVMIEILEGLAHAHSKSIIHRDIKPSNILITSDGVPRIADFGLARSVHEEKQLTIAGEMVGTAYFMSPEQGLAQKVDTRADLYAVGATYFYLVMGKYPFEGKTSIEVISKHINEPLPNMFIMKPDIPIWTAKIIEKLMKKNPEERYQSADEVLLELKKQRDRNYESASESSEMSYDLKDITKKNEEDHAAREEAKLKAQGEKGALPGLVMDRYSSEIMEMERTQNADKKAAALNQPKKESARRGKEPIRLDVLNKIIRTFYHFSAMLFCMMLFVFVGGSFQDKDNAIVSLMSPFLKWTWPAAILTVIGLVLAVFGMRLKPLKMTPVYTIFSLLMILLSYAGANLAVYPELTDSLARIFFNFSNAIANLLYPKNLWALSLVFLLVGWKTSSKESIYQKLISSFLFAISFVIFYSYLKAVSPYHGDTLEKSMLYTALSFMGLALLSNLLKGIMYVFMNPALMTAVACFFLTNAVEKPDIRRLTDAKEVYEAEKVAREKRMATITFQMEMQNSAGEIPEYDVEGRPIAKPKKDLNQILEKIKPAPREELEKISEAEYDRHMKSALFDSLRNYGSLLVLALALFVILNLMFFEELVFYEKMFSE